MDKSNGKKTISNGVKQDHGTHIKHWDAQKGTTSTKMTWTVASRERIILPLRGGLERHG